MGKLRNIFLALLSIPLMAGCAGSIGLSMLGADPEACSPTVARKARMFEASSVYLKQGLSKSDLFSAVGTPERGEWRTARNGEPVELLLYRTGHKSCSYMPTEADYTPVVLYRGTYWGQGEAFARNFVR